MVTSLCYNLLLQPTLAAMSEIEASSGNVYADLDDPEAGDTLIKASLTTQIAEILKRRHLTQQQAARILGIPQPKLSGLLRGQFRGVSQAKLLESLNRLGRDIDIIVRQTPPTRATDQTCVIVE